MTSLPTLRAERENLLGRLQAVERSSTFRPGQEAQLRAQLAQATRLYEVAADALRIERCGLLEAVGGMRWEAEQRAESTGSPDYRTVVDTLREVEKLIGAES